MRGLPTEGEPGRKGLHLALHCVPQSLVPSACQGPARRPMATRGSVPHTPPFPRSPRALQPPELEGQPGTSPVGTAGPGRAPPTPRVGVRGLRSRSAPQASPCPARAHRTLRGCGALCPGSRPARRGAKRGDPGQRPRPLPPLAWLGSVARKTWQAMGESGLSGCALIR